VRIKGARAGGAQSVVGETAPAGQAGPRVAKPQAPPLPAPRRAQRAHVEGSAGDELGRAGLLRGVHAARAPGWQFSNQVAAGAEKQAQRDYSATRALIGAARWANTLGSNGAAPAEASRREPCRLAVAPAAAVLVSAATAAVHSADVLVGEGPPTQLARGPGLAVAAAAGVAAFAAAAAAAPRAKAATAL
jgi:hypothetical protein